MYEVGIAFSPVSVNLANWLEWLSFHVEYQVLFDSLAMLILHVSCSSASGVINSCLQSLDIIGIIVETSCLSSPNLRLTLVLFPLPFMSILSYVLLLE